jgi:hypothetical protein
MCIGSNTYTPEKGGKGIKQDLFEEKRKSEWRERRPKFNERGKAYNFHPPPPFLKYRSGVL